MVWGQVAPAPPGPATLARRSPSVPAASAPSHLPNMRAASISTELSCVFLISAIATTSQPELPPWTVQGNFLCTFFRFCLWISNDLFMKQPTGNAIFPEALIIERVWFWQNTRCFGDAYAARGQQHLLGGEYPLPVWKVLKNLVLGSSAEIGGKSGARGSRIPGRVLSWAVPPSAPEGFALRVFNLELSRATLPFHKGL